MIIVGQIGNSVSYLLFIDSLLIAQPLCSLLLAPFQSYSLFIYRLEEDDEEEKEANNGAEK